jgi:hypothetical protein
MKKKTYSAHCYVVFCVKSSLFITYVLRVPYEFSSAWNTFEAGEENEWNRRRIEISGRGVIDPTFIRGKRNFADV